MKKYFLRLQWFFNYIRNLYTLFSEIEVEQLRKNATVDLNRLEYKVYSQHGEDGIIYEIFKRIGSKSKIFFEFGAGSGAENNTIHLLMQGWRGFWIDGNTSFVNTYKKLYKTSLEKKELIVDSKIITSKNINTIIDDLKIPKEIDLLSMDIDGNDYYVWKACTRISPRVVIIEYNSSYPAHVRFLQKESDRCWNGSNFFGSSLLVLSELAKEKGYTLVACDLIGGNAFFVRNDLLGNHFEYVGNIEKLYQKSKYYLNYYAGHPSTFNYGHIPVVGEWERFNYDK
jgi:hypothetical protein